MRPSSFPGKALVRIGLLMGGLLMGGLVVGEACADEGTPEYRLEAQRAWLFGRPDLLESLLPFRPEDARGDLTTSGQRIDPVDVWPYALRDLWWRPAGKRTRWQREQLLAWAKQRLEKTASSDVQAPYQWLLDGGDTPYPAPPIADDPWPVLSTLILDRQQRMKTGAEGYPDESPLARRRPPEAWRSWWDGGWFDGYQRMTVGQVYDGEDREAWDEEFQDEERQLDQEAHGLRRRNLGLAVGSLVALLASILLVAWGFERRRS